MVSFIRRNDGIGRRTGLKIPRWQHRAGSTPASGTKNRQTSQKSVDFTFFALHFGGLTALCKAPPRFDTAMENLIFLH